MGCKNFWVLHVIFVSFWFLEKIRFVGSLDPRNLKTGPFTKHYQHESMLHSMETSDYLDLILQRKFPCHLSHHAFNRQKEDNKSAGCGLNSCHQQRQIKLTMLDKLNNEHNLTELSQRTLRMFYHAYDNYMLHAYPKDELLPLSCGGADTWGGYSLTLVDSLDTLALLGNASEFRRASQLLLRQLDPLANVNVSVFETNIRVIGGLLSAHLLSERMGDAGRGWPCNGGLLEAAERFARRLLPAFDTKTGMPYGTVNLRFGVPVGETPIACTACVGTLVLEFTALSRLTGDPVFEEVANRALLALHSRRSKLGLVGNHIDVENDRWTAADAGIGSAVDSYFEYLAKGAMLFGRPELMDMFNGYRAAYDKHVKFDDWYFWVHMDKGHLTSPVFQSLDAFWPGLLSITGHSDQALRTLHNYHQVWKSHGFLPEFYNVPKSHPVSGREAYPLRPELIESIYYLHRATGDPTVLQMGVDVLTSIEHSARTECGFATVHNVLDHSLEDRMESFFLAETVKYLYLLFNPEHWLHQNSPRIVETPSGSCGVWSGHHAFNTEAHPIDASSLHCCHERRSGERVRTLAGLESQLDLTEALGLRVEPREEAWLAEAEKEEEKEAAEAAEAEAEAESPRTDWRLLTCPTPKFHNRLTVHGSVMP